MNRKSRAFRPESTDLESRNLLSVAGAPAPETAQLTMLPEPGTPAPDPGEVHILSDRSGTTPALAIANTVKGKYAAPEDNRAADAPLQVRVNGTGRVNGLGKVRMSGSLELGGFRMAGSDDVSGTLTLTNARGQVKIQLTGTGGFDEVPNGRFVTTVKSVKGTGAFRGFQRGGTVTFEFGENQIRTIKAPSPIGGAVTATLSLKPLVK
ncbi:hypothetical protein TA3x_000606 [Tundrisphaera sp. TA3]|uniref:hypothetical protein n=1 Tax=Tundrisphaera sp. TA3 TaxID=3435775 RepID=UPI003EB87EE2